MKDLAKAPQTVVDSAMAKVKADLPMMDSLKDWFLHKGYSPDPEIKKFEDWLETQLYYMAGCIHTVETDYLVEVLRVNAMGCPWAVNAVKNLKLLGLDADYNCYVEDNIVYANVWVSAKDAETAKMRADLLAKSRNEKGWSAEVWIDEEDDTECTVNAQLDFPLYYGADGKGVR